MNKDIILHTGALAKRYKHTTALNGVSISLERGRIYGLIGNNGAGKTTLMRCISGLTFPTSGSIELFGKTGKGLDAARSCAGFIIENPIGYGSLTIRKNLIAQAMHYGKVDSARIDELIGLVGLEKTAANHTPFRVCSFGQKQRYGIAYALLNNPELLVLDEPINGLDPAGMQEMRELFLKLNREHGVTILLSSHLLAHLYELASDFIFMDGGQVITERTHDEIAEACGDTPNLENYFFNLIKEHRGLR